MALEWLLPVFAYSKRSPTFSRATSSSVRGGPVTFIPPISAAATSSGISAMVRFRCWIVGKNSLNPPGPPGVTITVK